MPTYFSDFAYLGQAEPARDVTIDITGQQICAVIPNSAPPPNARHLPGLTLPGFVNGHSHVFHRALRGRNQHGVDSFWGWRDLMYTLADRLTPEQLYDLALGTFAEMSLAGVTAVGEFFYLHHGPGGQRYAEENLTGALVCQAAEDAGLRITLLDTLYLRGGVDGRPPSGAQLRFSDGSWQRWAERVTLLPTTELRRPGAAIHSVRAVGQQDFAPVAEFARNLHWPIHAHVSEQIAENQQTQQVYRMTPTELLSAAGVLGADFTSVHATWLSQADLVLTGRSASTVCMCPTTERDLADGVGPAAALRGAGAQLSVGSDGHMMIDLIEETRAMETNLRLVTGERGHFAVTELLDALTVGGARSIGWPSGTISVGALADLTCIALDTPRTAGASTAQMLSHIVFAASAADVRTVIRGGEIIVDDGEHRRVPEPGRLLAEVIGSLMEGISHG